MSLQGKGFFLWQIRNCENGNAAAIANAAQAAGFTHALLKVADGNYSYNIDSNGMDLIQPVVQALHAKGIQSLGWHYIYGDDPVGEASKAVQRIQQTGVDGYVLDVEGEYKDPGKGKAATQFMDRLRASYPRLPVALCSYRFPSYHPQVPWKEFLERCDYNMPQVYWQFSHNPADQLARCINEFQNITPFRPIIPVGSAYRSGSWVASPEEVVIFLQTAQSLNLSAANFWEWSNCRSYIPEAWNAIAAYSWSSAAPEKDIAEQYIDAMNAHDVNRVTGLYTSSAVHINAARTVQGTVALRAWYQSLFTQLLPNATFTLSSFTGTGSSRHLTWSATSSAGNVLDGSDTFGLANGKIAYHYTFFSVARSSLIRQNRI
jgi:hypothetical protein